MTISLTVRMLLWMGLAVLVASCGSETPPPVEVIVEKEVVKTVEVPVEVIVEKESGQGGRGPSRGHQGSGDGQ